MAIKKLDISDFKDIKFPTSYQELIYLRTYSRWIESEKRRETWPETVYRYYSFFIDRIPKNKRSEYNEAINAILSLQVMPSMRALWAAGKALQRENICGYNCAYLHIDNVKAFAEMLYCLMNSTGVGFSVERQYINKLPVIPEELKDVDTTIDFADSKLGWANGLYTFLKELYKGRICSYDLSKLRPAGARLKTFGGRASGPEPLRDLLEFCKSTFINAKGRRLNSLEVFDICCKIADIVVCGGVRRAATIALTNLSDERMKHAKDGEFWLTHPHRALANISVAYTEKPNPAFLMKEWINLVRSKNGERGIFNREGAQKFIASQGRRDANYDFSCNPCCLPADVLIKTNKGDVPISDIIRNGIEKYKVATLNIETGKIEWQSIIEGKKTRLNAKLIELEFEDGEKLKLTPDHRIMLESGQWIHAEDLKENDVVKAIQLQIIHKRIKKISTTKNEDTYDLQTNNKNFFANNILVHNSEIILRSNEFCNLSSVIIREDDTIETLKEKVRLATILGTVQSTLTQFKFLNRNWRKNCEEERLLGVSLTGLADHPVLNKKSSEAKQWLFVMKQEAINTAKEWAHILEINVPVAVTCVKPEGTTSQLTGASSGLHPRYSLYYIRRIRIDSMDPLCKLLKDAGVPCHPENGQSWEKYNTLVFEFPMKSPDQAVMRDEMTAIQQLEYWKMLQEYWCEHKPSCTIYVKEDEWIEVLAWVSRNWDFVSGISFLPYDTGIYKLAPFEEIDEDTYNELIENFPEINFNKLSEYELEDETCGAQEFACQGGACEI